MAVPELEPPGANVASSKRSILHHLCFTLAKDQYTAARRDHYEALAYTVRDRSSGHGSGPSSATTIDAKRVYYLSLEFLLGRLLPDVLINLGLMRRAVGPCANWAWTWMN